MNQNNQQLDRLEKIISLVDETYVKPEEVVTMFEAVAKAIQDTRSQLERQITSGDEMSSNECEKMAYEMKDMELRVQNLITEAKQSSMVDIKSLASRLNDDIGRVRALIPSLPDLSYIDRKLSSIEAKIPKLPPPVILDEGEQIVDKINDLPTDDESLKIDASHIKNLPKVTEIHRGGGMHYIAGANITIEGNVISSTGGVGAWHTLTINETGIFAVASEPVEAYADGTTYLPGYGYTYSTGFITFDQVPQYKAAWR